MVYPVNGAGIVAHPASYGIAVTLWLAGPRRKSCGLWPFSKSPCKTSS